MSPKDIQRGKSILKGLYDESEEPVRFAPFGDETFPGVLPVDQCKKDLSVPEKHEYYPAVLWWDGTTYNRGDQQSYSTEAKATTAEQNRLLAIYETGDDKTRLEILKNVEHTRTNPKKKERNAAQANDFLAALEAKGWGNPKDGTGRTKRALKGGGKRIEPIKEVSENDELEEEGTSCCQSIYS